MRKLILFLQFLTVLHLKITPTKQDQSYNSDHQQIDIETTTPTTRRFLQNDGRPHVSVTNKAKKAVMVHCHGTKHDYLKEWVAAGDRIKWELQNEEKDLQDMPMVCYVDMRNLKHAHGYFSGFQKDKCTQCDWNIRPDGKVELRLRNGKWLRQNLVQDEEKLSDSKKDDDDDDE